MSPFIYLVIVFVTTYSSNAILWDPAKCLVAHYMDLGCDPIMGSSCCPERYNCSHMEDRSPKKCYISGVTYDIGDIIPSEAIKYDCVSCKCVSDARSEARVECTNEECPEHSPRISDAVIAQYSMNSQCTPNAVFQYQSNKCCAVGQVVGAAEISKLATCELDGEIYREGQKMYPKARNCAVCICGKDFTGKIEAPFCRNFTCGSELHDADSIRDFCAPVYYGTTLCCPIDWKCHEDTDEIIPGPNSESITDPNMICKYSDIKVKKGDIIIAKDKKCTVCGCHIPPMVTCVTDPECDRQM